MNSIRILNIHTTTPTALVNVSVNGEVLEERRNEDMREHSRFLHTAIEEMMQSAKWSMNSLNAVAATCGPGSYTGIRIGMAAAKGLCYALDVPFISINTLDYYQFCARRQYPGYAYYIPMIDARRLEVFAAIYDAAGKEIEAPHACVLTADSYGQYASFPTLFFGSGSDKFSTLAPRKNNFIFENVSLSGAALARQTLAHFEMANFADIAYSNAQYVKEVFTGPAPKNL